MHRHDGDTQLDEPRPARAAIGDAPPDCVRLLCLSAVEPVWLPLTLELQAAGWSEQHCRWVSQQAGAIGLLRDEGFDCLLLEAADDRSDLSVAALLEFLRALRAGGHDEGALLVSSGLSDGEWAGLLDVDCEVVVTSRSWECPAVVPAIRQAACRARLVRENSQLSNAQRRRLVRERDEATQLITQQWRMLDELRSLSIDFSRATDDSPPDSQSAPSVAEAGDESHKPPSFADRVPPDLGPYYHELLRIYVIMGSGSLGTEISRLADRLAGAGLTPREVLELHLERVETLVRRLGSRSARHVLARADLLALEVMMHLGECYQRRSAVSAPAGVQPPSCSEQVAA